MLIFLDIDGVMVPAKNWQRPELLDDGFAAFSPKAVAVIQELLVGHTDSTIILTTSHKTRFSIELWKDIFFKRSLLVSKIQLLNNNMDMISRRLEILNWFNTNEIHEDFIIIDDDKSLNDLPNFLKKRLVLTSSIIGLDFSHLCHIQAILGDSNVQYL